MRPSTLARARGLLFDMDGVLYNSEQPIEGAAEALFVFGCYVGEVMARALGGRWMATARTPLAKISPWPMVVVLRDGSTWDPIGKVYKRLELGDSEYLPAYFVAAAAAGGAR